MDRITSIAEIVANVAAIRDMGKGFVTNFYLNEPKHNLWIGKGVLFAEWVGDTYFIIKQNAGFWNVFYTSTSIEELGASLKIFNKDHHDKTLMLDVVGRKDSCEQVASCLAGVNLGEYCKLVRMWTRTPKTVECMTNGVTFASKDDVATVHALLHQFFDEQTEQLPYLEELEDLAATNQVLVLKQDGKLAGFVVFELSKVSLYLRYWFVHPDFRNQGVGGQLLNRYFYEGRNTKRAQHWVICTNENAIKRYLHYGYTEENMFDYVLTNKDIHYEG